MAVETVNRLIDELRRCEILDEPQLALIEREATGQFTEPKLFAKELITRGWLTRYQARLLLVGRGSELTLGAYRLLDRLGSGGMGQVFKAVHVPMNRTVALKVVRPELVADEKTLRRFRREVQAAAQLNHPNIVTVFDAAHIGDSYFLAMEYIYGVDFADLVRDSGPLPIHSACDCIRQASVGLQHARDRGLIHRDVKPSNLLLTRNPPGIVKILDMGLARPVNLDGGRLENQTALTLDGAVLGTPDFMAPEQAKNSRTVDHRADIYALGCTFYYLLTARMPFPIANIMEKLLKHQFEQPYTVELARPGIPSAVQAALQRMMAKDPEDRFQCGDDVAKALEPFCKNGTESTGTIIDVIPADADARPSSVTTPAGSNDSSPFNFGPPPAQLEIAAPRGKTDGRRVGIILAGAGILVLIATVALIAIVTALAGGKQSPAAAPPSSSTPTQRDSTTTMRGRADVPAPLPAAQADDERLERCIADRAAFAVVVDVPQLLGSKAMETHLRPMLKPLFEHLRPLKIDPYTQADRLVVSVVPGTPDQFIAILLGSYATNELREFARRSLNLGPRDAPGELSIATLPLEKDRQNHIAGFGIPTWQLPATGPCCATPTAHCGTESPIEATSGC